MLYRLTTVLVLCALAAPSAADQSSIPDYDNARTRVFYRLYVNVPQIEATDIYCGLRFKVPAAIAKTPEGKEVKRPADWLTLEHAYAAQWMADALGCGDRKTCARDAPDHVKERFNRAEADLHNLWPALASLNFSRGDRLFGHVGSASQTAQRAVKIGAQTFQCPFENAEGIVEPRRIVRGNLARSIFYMCEEYGFPVEAAMLEILKRWNKADRPTRGERRRHERIAERQGTRNRFIDEPGRADALACTVT